MDALNALYKLIMVLSTVWGTVSGVTVWTIYKVRPDASGIVIKLEATNPNDAPVLTVDGLSASCTYGAHYLRVCTTAILDNQPHLVITQSFFQARLISEDYVWSQPCVFLPELHRGPYTGPPMYGLPFDEEIETPIPPN